MQSSQLTHHASNVQEATTQAAPQEGNTNAGGAAGADMGAGTSYEVGADHLQEDRDEQEDYPGSCVEVPADDTTMPSSLVVGHLYNAMEEAEV
jgi:hypothetical protein